MEPSRFRILAQREDCLQEIRIQLNVIGASHLVNIEWEKGSLSELLACRKGGLGEPAMALAAPIPLGRRIGLQTARFDYSIRLDWECLPPEAEALPDRLLPQGHLTTAASFPSLPGSPAAMTAIGADIGSWHCQEGLPAATLELRSVHWYQTERIAVSSHTLLKLYKGEKPWIEEP
jgi:hypothetical protein